MHSTPHLFTLSLILLPLISATSSPNPIPYKLGRMSLNPLSGFSLLKRQDGYQPTQSLCGLGDTCVEACGADYTTCASNDDELHCYEPSLGETCCPNLSGDSCSEGYYCTQDDQDETWCCPTGMSLQQCASTYSITGVLQSLTSAPPSSTPATIPITSTTSSELYTPSSSYGKSSSKATATGAVGTGTGSRTSTGGGVQFTGAAGGKDIKGGLMVAIVVGAVGLVL